MTEVSDMQASGDLEMQRQRERQQQGVPGQTQGGGTAAAPLPPTGLQRQGATIQQQQQQSMAAGAIGGTPPGQQMVQPPAGPVGATSLDALARGLAQNYGLPLGRGPLVDAQGNFLMTPDQIAAGSGGTVNPADAAAQLNYIAAAIANEQNRRQNQKAVGTLQTGLGQIQSRGRGSAATMQSGLYQSLAQTYSSQTTEATDFSYYIAREQIRKMEEISRRMEKAAKKSARGAMIGGVIGAIAGTFLMPGLGTAAGYQLGSSLGGGGANAF